MLDADNATISLTGDLRRDLRSATGPAHRRLDEMVEGLDVATSRGLGIFLQASGAALDVLSPSLAQVSLPPIQPLQVAIARDLGALGLRPIPPIGRVSVLSDDAALGAYYVIAGSRLGAQVLRRHHAASPDERVRGADAYLTAPTGLGMWKAFIYRLVEVDSEISHAAVLNGAHHTFEVFFKAFKATLLTEGTGQ